MFNEILNKEKVNVGKLKNEKTLKKSFNLFKVGSLSRLRGRKKSDIAVTRVWDSGVEILNVQIWRVSSTIKSPLAYCSSRAGMIFILVKTFGVRSFRKCFCTKQKRLGRDYTMNSVGIVFKEKSEASYFSSDEHACLCAFC